MDTQSHGMQRVIVTEQLVKKGIFMIKYATYNPFTGENTLHDSKELALQAFWSLLINHVKRMGLETAYTTVEILEDGSEKWYNDNNQEIERPRTATEIEALLQSAREQSNSQS